MTTTSHPVILIVDDAAENLHVLYELLRPHYRVLAANSGEGGLRVAHSEPTPDLILLDVMMPGMDGYAVLAKLRESSATRDIPVVFLTALADAGDEERGLQLGAADYITKPISPLVVLARVRTQLEAKQARDGLRNQNALLEAEVARRMAENDLTQRVSIRALAHLAETRDTETGNHIMRTQGYVQRLAVGLRQHPRFAATLSDRYIDLLSRSAPLHDIGKVGIPDYILLKPGKLTPDEMAIMQTHAALGSDAIEQAEGDIEMPLAFLATAKEIAHWHHEKWDGSGYPDRLAGEAIPRFGAADGDRRRLRRADLGAPVQDRDVLRSGARNHRRRTRDPFRPRRHRRLPGRLRRFRRDRHALPRQRRIAASRDTTRRAVMTPAGKPPPQVPRTMASATLRVVLVYAAFACLWILLSDRLVALLFSDPQTIALVSTIKGWLFVGVTSLLLYGLIKRLAAQVTATSKRELAAQNERIRTRQLLDVIADSSPDAIFAKDREGRYLLFNRETARLIGKRAGEAIGFDDTALFPPEQAAMIRANDVQVIAAMQVKTYEETIATVDGERTFLAIKGPLRDESGEVIGIFGISRDITERKNAELKIQRLGQFYAALSGCSQAIVRSTSEAELFPEICRCAVEFGGLKMAWIGLADAVSLNVRPVASFGDATDFLQALQVSCDAESDLGRGATGTAIRERRPVWVQDFLNDPITAPWHEQCARAGWRSSAALPLTRNGVAVGTLVLYSSEINAFDQEIRELLMQMAADVSLRSTTFRAKLSVRRTRRNCASSRWHSSRVRRASSSPTSMRASNTSTKPLCEPPATAATK